MQNCKAGLVAIALLSLVATMSASAGPDTNYDADIAVTRPVDDRIAYRPDLPRSTHPTAVNVSPAATVITSTTEPLAVTDNLLAGNTAGSAPGQKQGSANLGIATLVNNSIGGGTGSLTQSSGGGGSVGGLAHTITAGTAIIPNVINQSLSPIGNIGK